MVPNQTVGGAIWTRHLLLPLLELDCTILSGVQTAVRKDGQSSQGVPDDHMRLREAREEGSAVYAPLIPPW